MSWDRNTKHFLRCDHGDVNLALYYIFCFRKQDMKKDAQSPPSLVPERATYGFVSCLLCYVSFSIYLMWAYIPKSYQEWMGLTYWPNKFFAVAIPPFLCVLFLGSYVIYEGLIFINTAPVDSPDIISNSQKEQYDCLSPETITPIEELSIIDVNKSLYSV